MAKCLADGKKHRPLTKEEADWYKSQGYNPQDITVELPDNSPTGQSQTNTAPVSPADLKNAVIWMDNFMGMTNVNIMADVISVKTESLKFCLSGQTYDYSGHYTVVLNKPRQHSKPYFGLGTPATAKLVILEDVGGESMPLQDTTIWDNSNGFIDLTALNKEWLYSGSYTIQK